MFVFGELLSEALGLDIEKVDLTSQLLPPEGCGDVVEDLPSVSTFFDDDCLKKRVRLARCDWVILYVNLKSHRTAGSFDHDIVDFRSSEAKL